MDLRERIVAAYMATRETNAELAERFCVSTTTIKRLGRRAREGAELAPRKPSGRPRVLTALHLRWLARELRVQPYLTSYELCARFRRRFLSVTTHRSTILRAMHDVGFTFKKKTTYAPARDQPGVRAERAIFARSQSSLDVTRLFCVDESGCHPGIGPRRGWSPRGDRLYGPEQAYARGQHISMIAALSLDGISASMTVRGGVKTKHFYKFVRDKLVPTLRPGDVILWDNLNLHKNDAVLQEIQLAGASVIPLPRYSPDFNPIESAWAKVKAWIRKRFPQTVSQLRGLIRRSLRRVRPSDARGWFRHCGYDLPSF